jgi:uncharacterized caspase-like protein
MADVKKPTPTQRVKELEAENDKLKKLIFALKDDHAQQVATASAEYGNGQYTLGYQEGHRDAMELSAAQQSQSYITRLFKK